MKKTQKGIIQRIEYSKNEHSLEFVDATIYYNDGSYEIIEGAMNVYNAIALLGRQYDLEVGEVLKKSEICKEIKTKAMITSEVSENASTRVVRRRKVNSETTRPTIRTNPSEFETTTVEEEVLEETPKKSRKPIIKGLAIFTAGILATVGTIELCRYLKDKHVEATKVPAITETMTSISRNTDLTGYNQTFNDNLNISIKDYQRLNEIMAKINNNLGMGLSKGDIFKLCIYGQTLGIIISNFNMAMGLLPSGIVSGICVVISINMISAGAFGMNKPNQV